MTLKLFLEEFKGSGKFKGIYTEIFLEPSNKNMIDVSSEIKGEKYIRFISNAKATYLYVFSPEVFHTDVADHIKKSNIKPFDKNSDNQIWGTAKYTKGKWIFDGSDKIIPVNFNWNNLIKKKIYKNESIEFEKRNIWDKEIIFSSKTSIYPTDFKDKREGREVKKYAT